MKTGAEADEDAVPRDGRPKAGGRVRRLLKRALLVFLGAVVLPLSLYLGAAEVLMRWPVNGDVDPLDGEVNVYLVAGGPHVDLWIPTVNAEHDWRGFLPADMPLPPYGYVRFGWGDRAFYTEVPSWSDLTVSVALRGACWPSPTAMRVTSFSGRPIEGDHVRLVRVSAEGYRDLCSYIRAGFALADGRTPVPIAFEGYGSGLADRFFEGDGSYHLFRTCNTWTNGALKAAGKRAARRAFVARGVLFHQPENGGKAE